MRIWTLVFTAFLGLSMNVQAHDYTAGSLVVHHPAVNATPPSAKVAAGYFSVKNNSDDDDVLLSIEAPSIADKTEIHSMSMDDGIMKMRKLKDLNLPVGVDTQLSPKGTHVMFIGLKQPLVEGQKYDATLHFQKAGDVVVKFNVESVGTLPVTEHKH